MEQKEIQNVSAIEWDNESWVRFPSELVRERRLFLPTAGQGECCDEENASPQVNVGINPISRTQIWSAE